jgi:hypothetical protein
VEPRVRGGNRDLQEVGLDVLASQVPVLGLLGVVAVIPNLHPVRSCDFRPTAIEFDLLGVSDSFNMV